MAAIVDVTTEAKKHARALGVPFFASLEELFQGRLVDGVILATPSDLHKNQGVLCAKNNIPALIEKPLATTISDAEALVRISQGDLRKAITALQVAAALEKNVTRSLIYETSATAPPESLHQYLMACRQDGFHAARRRLRELLDKYGLAGTDFVNQLDRELYGADFLSEIQKLELTELMAEIDFRLVEGGGEAIQLDALTARLSKLLG